MKCEDCENYKPKKELEEKPLWGEDQIKEVKKILSHSCAGISCKNCIFDNFGALRNVTDFGCGRSGIRYRIKEVEANVR